jgi:hypothetical protein
VQKRCVYAAISLSVQPQLENGWKMRFALHTMQTPCVYAVISLLRSSLNQGVTDRSKFQLLSNVINPPLCKHPVFMRLFRCPTDATSFSGLVVVPIFFAASYNKAYATIRASRRGSAIRDSPRLGSPIRNCILCLRLMVNKDSLFGVNDFSLLTSVEHLFDSAD